MEAIVMAIATTEAKLIALVAASSVSLPVGGYAFSQGHGSPSPRLGKK